MSKEQPPGFGTRMKQFFLTLWDWKTPVIVGAILILVGIGLLLRYDETQWLPQKLAGLFASELGFACVIAALIFATLEEWAARHHAKTAIGLLYGVKPKGDVFDKIEEHVLKQ
ncbi:MAG TPA: hypothetical protein VES64_05255, partial [Allosphingosinicella sp.]|nr:hypothetical protein [Allosphingosinicella sp.]